MTLFPLGRASAIGVAILFLGGCGGSPQSVATIPQGSSAVRETAQHRTSGSGDLVYATGGGRTYILSYPDGILLNTFNSSGSGTCSDSKGNVFLTKDTTVDEYAHGATTPTATLALPGKLAIGCAVDPQTNNLAVVFESSGGDIAIFPNEGGTPSVFSSHIDSSYCGYDNSGNLFVDGYSGPNSSFSELSSGGSAFTKLSISDSVGSPGQVQWDGQYITYEGIDTKNTLISRLSISGSTANIVSQTRLKGIKRRAYASWIYKGAVVVPYSTHGPLAKRVGTWAYPKGGQKTKAFPHFSDKKTILNGGVTLSVGA